LKDILTEHDQSVKDVLNRLAGTTVRFYGYQVPGSKLSNVYLDTDVLGSGFVLTSDGWLVTSQKVVRDPRAALAVQIENKIYAVKEIVADTLTDVVLVKIEAQNLAVAELGTKNSLTVGQTMLVATNNLGVRKAAIDDLTHVDLSTMASVLHSSENFYQYIRLNDTFGNDYIGAPVLNLNGKVVGLLADAKGMVLPIDYFASIMKTAIQDGTVVRNSLGVNYVDLTAAPNFVSSVNEGALLASDGIRPAVVANSPASKAGLLAGDIIMKVENEEVNSFNTLTQLIQDYSSDATIKLRVWRGDKEIELSVTLEKL
jgi:serine protease Do